MRFITLLFIFILFSIGLVVAESNFNPLTKGYADTLYCHPYNLDDCPVNITTNITNIFNTSSFIGVVHDINGTNHTGNLSTSRIIKDSGTGWLGLFLDTILDIIFSDRGETAFKNESNNFELNQTINGSTICTPSNGLCNVTGGGGGGAAGIWINDTATNRATYNGGFNVNDTLNNNIAIYTENDTQGRSYVVFGFQ